MKMTNKNSVTGDTIVTKYSESYSNNFDAIFRKKNVVEDLKTGVEYNPDEKFKELINSPEFLETMIRMGKV